MRTTAALWTPNFRPRAKVPIGTTPVPRWPRHKPVARWLRKIPIKLSIESGITTGKPFAGIVEFHELARLFQRETARECVMNLINYRLERGNQQFQTPLVMLNRAMSGNDHFAFARP